METTINKGMFTNEKLLKAHNAADRTNKYAYNWDELTSLFTIDNSPEQIAKDLLYIFFEMTSYYMCDDEKCGGNKPLDRALYTIRELYDAISCMTGDAQDKRLLCFVSKFDLKSE